MVAVPVRTARPSAACAALGAILLCLSWSWEAQAGFVKGPYLQQVSQTSIFVCWESDSYSAGTVEYGTTESLGLSVGDSSTNIHQVQLTDLEPSTVYYYRVSSGSDTSSTGSFVTAPLSEQPFSFVVMGDTRTGTDDHQAVVDQILATLGAPLLYFNSGDLVEDGGSSDQWTDFFSIESELLQLAPFFPVAGNHDDVANDSIYTELFHLPDSSSATEAYYAFTYGNTRFVIVDTNEDFVTGSQQYQWIEDELATADADPAILHEIVLFHHPPYTSGAHGVFDSDEWSEVRTYLVPLFSDHGVDLVFNGHDHHYERSDPSLTGDVLYVVTGGGGAPGSAGDFVDGIDTILEYLLGMEATETVGEYLEDNSAIMWILNLLGYAEDYEGGWWRAEVEVMKHFILVEVQGGLISGTVYKDDGTVFDTWTVGSYDPDQVDDDGDGYTENEGDCDDADAGIHPGADDPCDGLDQDCDGLDNGCDTGSTVQPGDTGSPGQPDDQQPGTSDSGQGETNGTNAPSTGCSCGSALRPGIGPWGILLLGAVLLARWRKH